LRRDDPIAPPVIIYVAHALHSKTATYYLQRSFAALQNAFTLRVHLKARPRARGAPEREQAASDPIKRVCPPVCEHEWRGV